MIDTPMPKQPPAEHRTIAFKADVIAEAHIDLDLLLKCLEMVENGKETAIGGKLCWTKQAWVEDAGSFIPFASTANNETSRLIAAVRLHRLANLLHKTKDITPYALALLWNKGYSGTIKELNSRHTMNNNYAVRVTNLYYDTLN